MGSANVHGMMVVSFELHTFSCGVCVCVCVPVCDSGVFVCVCIAPMYVKWCLCLYRCLLALQLHVLCLFMVVYFYTELLTTYPLCTVYLRACMHACVLVDEEEAAFMLLSVIMQNKFRQLSELLDSSYFSIDYQFGRGKRTLLHSAAR